MNSIKTYLLPLFFLLFMSVSSIAQSSIGDKRSEEQKLSTIDSVLINTYFTEKDYNELHNIKVDNRRTSENDYYADEIYNEEPHPKHKVKGSFWDTVAVDIAVDVVVNSIYLIAVFWQ